MSATADEAMLIEHSLAALRDIALMGARCTCMPDSPLADIVHCPNYLPGDELPENWEADDD